VFNFKIITAVFIFLFVFISDLLFDVEPQWYFLLLCLIYLLFGVQPSKALVQILTAVGSKDKKSEKNSP
tara:strand:- start:452 stop:658 length:207 start_codon:yes stop_codon:yes gene_type:complete